MLIYILKFSACLAIFMMFYKLFLERENMHIIKRYYLLIALFLALIIPFVTFIRYIEPVSNITTFTEIIPQLEIESQNITIEQTFLNYLPHLLWSIYVIGTLIFFIKFSNNLSQLITRIKQNSKIKFKNYKIVLLLDLSIPHTFFNYIFLNKSKFEKNEIPESIIIHEETHARQKHSIDVLIIELLQIIFWFHPLIYLTKRSIKLNHEFLADSAVLKQGTMLNVYQELLLTYSSNTQQPQLANAFNYSSIKKRFKVMKTQTSKQNIWLKSLILLPLFALTLYGFSEKKIVVKEVETTLLESDTIQDITIYIQKNNHLLLNDKPVKFEDLSSEVNKLNVHLLPEQKQRFLSARILFEDQKSEDFIKNIQRILLKCNIYISSSINVNTLKKYGLKSVNKNQYSGKSIEEAENIYENETIDLSISKGNEADSPCSIDITKIEEFEGTDHKDTIQQKATAEELDEYNKLARYYNDLTKEKLIVKLRDLDRMLNLISKMNKEQKEMSEPYPDFKNAPFKSTDEMKKRN